MMKLEDIPFVIEPERAARLGYDRCAVAAWVMGRVAAGGYIAVYMSLRDENEFRLTDDPGWDWNGFDYWIATDIVALDKADPLCLYKKGRFGFGDETVPVIKIEANGYVNVGRDCVGADPAWRVNDAAKGYPRNGSLIRLDDEVRTVGRWLLASGNRCFYWANGRLAVGVNNVEVYLDDGSVVESDRMQLSTKLVERLCDE